MSRRIALLIALALPLSGCVTYEVVERRVYHADGSYSRVYDPYDDGRRYEDDRYGDGRRYEYDRYDGSYGYDDDPYDLWFYGWRGPGTVLYVDPWYDRGHWFTHRPYSRSGWRSAWSWGWSSHGGWGSSWSGYWGASRPWLGGYSPSWNHGYGYGYTPQRPHRPQRPRPQQPQSDEPIARPKPSVRAPGTVIGQPRLDDAPLRPGTPTRPRWEEPESRPPRPQQDAIARPKPRPGLIDAPPRFETPREEPRFEPREEPRFEPREEPRFEPREEPRFEPREEPRFEPREERERPEVEARVE